MRGKSTNYILIKNIKTLFVKILFLKLKISIQINPKT